MEPISGANHRRRQLIMGGVALGSSLATLGSPPAGAVSPGDRSHQAVNVRDFGARGDGLTDDTIAIQSAVSAGFAAGINCHMPAGTYKITSPIIASPALLGAPN